MFLAGVAVGVVSAAVAGDEPAVAIAGDAFAAADVEGFSADVFECFVLLFFSFFFFFFLFSLSLDDEVEEEEEEDEEEDDERRRRLFSFHRLPLLSCCKGRCEV